MTTDSGSSIFWFSPDTSQIGVLNILFYASDGEFADSEMVAIEVEEAPPAVNHAPVLAEIGPKSVRCGDTLRFAVSASDPDGTTPSVFAVNLPRNASLMTTDSGSSVFSFSPDTSQIGVYNILFYASDGEFADSEIVAVAVLASNKYSPTIGITGGIEIDSIIEGSVLVLTVVAEDRDGDVLTVNLLDTAPDNSAFTGGNGRFEFRFEPSYVQSGTYPVRFMATDGELADTVSVSIVVLDAGNQLPRWLNEVRPLEVAEGRILICRLDAYDPDAKKLRLTAENLPNHCTFVDSGNGRAGLFFYPDTSDIGTHVITFAVTDDSGATASMNNSITVTNLKPEIFANVGENVFVGEEDTLVIRIETRDVGAVSGILSVLNLPPNATFTYTNRSTGYLNFYPVAGQAGQYHILCIACDERDSLLCDSLDISVTVQVVTQNQGPLIPTAVGNYWVYGNWFFSDSSEIVSVSAMDGEIWWNISSTLGRESWRNPNYGGFWVNGYD